VNDGGASRKSRLYCVAKRIAFALGRLRHRSYLFEGTLSSSQRRCRLLHVGDPHRGRPFVEGIYGRYPDPEELDPVLVGPSPGVLRLPRVDHNLVLIEINRLYAAFYRYAGYFVIPEWVQFGRAVVTDESRRYAGASKSLKCDLKAIRATDLRVRVSTDRADFERFHDSMYLPHVDGRFGEAGITKSRRRLERDFLAGFLMLVEDRSSPVAGAIVRIDGSVVSETTLGVLAGSRGLLRSRVSALLDFEIHRWAARHGKRYINVGHTRPFPRDGVFFNKRKWQMSVRPDEDGVTSFAMGFPRTNEGGVDVLDRFPFVFQKKDMLGVVCGDSDNDEFDTDRTQKLINRWWTPGLDEMIVICPGGFRSETADRIHSRNGTTVHLCRGLDGAIFAYRNGNVSSPGQCS
jgi:hypothetical protein